MGTPAALEQTRESLNRVQQFDAKKLSREADLGKQLNFSEAVAFAQALIDIYRRIPMATLEDLADGQLNTIHSQAQADYGTFDQILKFDATAGNAAATRAELIKRLQTRRDELFNQVLLTRAEN